LEQHNVGLTVFMAEKGGDGGLYVGENILTEEEKLQPHTAAKARFSE